MTKIVLVENIILHIVIAVGRQSINVSQITNDSKTENYTEVEPGGHWKPAGCYSRDRVAIVIPFRDRQTHLNILLKYLHPLLQRQQIEYRIFVVEQVRDSISKKSAGLLLQMLRTTDFLGKSILLIRLISLIL